MQGLSVDAAVRDLDSKVFENGMAYVALSHVRTLDGAALIDLVSNKIKTSESDWLRRAHGVEDRKE